MFTRDSVIISHNIKTPLTSISRAVGNILQLTYSQLIKSLFANNEQGFAYDPNDLSTMYQDAAGTVPVTAAGQPVGLMLDKSKGLTLGAEVISNSIANWSVTNATLTADANNLTLVNTSTTEGQAAHGSVLADKFYKVSLDVISASNGGVMIFAGKRIGLNGTGKKSYILTSNVGGNFRLGTNNASVGDTLTVANLSVKELSGNHAYQTVSASRPILRQTPVFSNELIQDGGFDNPTKWVLPKGWKVVDSRLVLDGTGNGAAYQAVQLNAVSDYLVEFDLVSRTGNVDFFLGSGATYALSTLGTGRKSFIMKRGVNNNCGFYASAVGAQVVVDNLSIKEITGYRTDQNYLSFDGIDDSLQTNNIDFTATDKVSLFAGVRKLSDAAAANLIELSTFSASFNGSFHLRTPTAAGSSNYEWASKGTLRALAISSSSYTSPVSNVICAKGNISGDSAVLRINGVQAASSAIDQGAGRYGNYPLYIGRRGGTADTFNGHIYGLIGVGKLVSDGETVAIEKELAKRVGVTLNV